ncbi:MAG TPA: tyrosine-type recombinase/integrase, partial [Epulopiscium sp.]|nr:tyrosine-type recombinase/integrase [Candidatus Epulonipiscium sp.]
YATELLKAGFSLVEIQRLMGHEDISTTTIYLHLDLDDLAEKIKNRPGLTG